MNCIELYKTFWAKNDIFDQQKVFLIKALKNRRKITMKSRRIISKLENGKTFFSIFRIVQKKIDILKREN